MMKRICAFSKKVQFTCFTLSKDSCDSRCRCFIRGRMTERPAKRLKQSSLSEFSFSKQAKPTSFQSSEVTEVITITDSPSEEESDNSKDKITDKLVMASSGHEQLETKTDGDLSGHHHAIPSTELKGDNQTSTSSSGVRKRPIADLSPTLGDSNAGSPESPADRGRSKDVATGVDQTLSYSLSPDLFTDSEPLTDSVDCEDIMDRVPGSHTSQPMGTPLVELNRTPGCSQRLPPLQVNESHTVLFQVPYRFDSLHACIPVPFPDKYHDQWDADHVRMPCSHHNEYPIMEKVRRRWELIEKALRGDLSDADKLQKAILSYNTRYASRWDFSALHRLCNEEFTALEANKFFNTTVRNIAHLALKLPHLCTQPIPLLKTDKTHSLTLSQQQISCLLANAFFCTFPRRNARGRNSEYAAYPDINFNSLFAGACHRKFEKLKCILHYFNRVADPSSVPLGTVTFTRQTLQQLPDWAESATHLRNLHVATDGKIEDDGAGMLQVDFANKFIGGGVLGRGCVQEEIRFMICPEMIVSRLFTEVLNKNECLIMTGCERFSNYTGYADSFRWLSDHIDLTERDEWGRCRTEVVAIDALVIRDYSSQFKAWCVKRELDKAYCGFYKSHTKINNLPAVCTGNWGCGAFGGEKQLKALVQLMAASEAGREVCYFTFDDAYLQKQLFDIHKFIRDEEKLCIGDVLKIIQQYYRNECAGCPTRPHITLFNYIYQVFSSNQSSSDGEAPVGGDLHQSTLSTTNSIDYKADTP